MKDIIITTTNNIEGATIERYIDIISTNVVIGTNVLSDFAASFTDFFGGTSETYQKKLDLIYKSAIDTLSQKAKVLGANCILGLHIDFDEISGKGKSMFMISAIGTAVKVQINIKTEKEEKKKQTSNFIISSEQLNLDYLKRDIIQRVSSGELLTPNDWEFLSSCPIVQIASLLFDKYIEIINTSQSPSEKESLLLRNFSYYLGKLNNDEALLLVKERINQCPKYITQLICNNNLFDPELIIDQIKNGKMNIAIHLLQANKEYYTNDDLLKMKEIISLIDSLPDKGTMEIVKGVFSKGEEKYICPNGHKNPASTEFCQEYACNLNIKGFTCEQTEQINVFKTKVTSLEALLATTN